MATWTFFDATTGRNTGVRFTGNPAMMALNTPPGQVAVSGAIDPMVSWLNVSTQQLVQAPQPAGDYYTTYAWSDQAGAWLASPTAAATARDVRAQRDSLLTACDWTQVADGPLTSDQVTAWRTYRTALRNMPAQPGFPDTVTWPTQPE